MVTNTFQTVQQAGAQFSDIISQLIAIKQELQTISSNASALKTESHEISATTQQQAATMQQLSLATAQLIGMSQEMEQNISTFRTE